MQDGKNRMMEQHSESGIFHHFFITSFHFFRIAVDFTGTAECLWLYDETFICLFPGCSVFYVEIHWLSCILKNVRDRSIRIKTYFVIY